MTKREWHPTISGASLRQMRKRAELSRREAAEKLTRLMHRDVATTDVDVWEQGQQPSRIALGALIERTG